MKKLLMYLLAVALLSTTAVSCNKEKDDDVSDSSNVASVVSEEEEVPLHLELFPTLDSNEITLVYTTNAEDYAQMLSEGKQDSTWQAIKIFEEAYGGKVNVAKASWLEMMPKAVNMQAAGEGVDLLRAQTDNQFPNIVVNDIVMSPEDVPGFDASYFSSSILDVKYKGKGYFLAPNTSSLSPTLMTYNVNMIEENLCKDPLEYYDEGNWNFDAFDEIGRAVTRDIDGDGKYDTYAMEANNMGSIFAIANDAPMVALNDEGIFANLNDPKLITAWDYLYKWTSPPEQGGILGMEGGKQIFETEGYAFILFHTPSPEIGFDWNQVPVPVGPDNTEGKLWSQPGAWTICKGSNNPQGALAWVLCQADPKIKAENDQRMIDRVGQEAFDAYQRRFSYEASKNLKFNWSYDKGYENCYAVLWQINDKLATKRMPATTVAQELQSVVTANLIKTFGADEVVF